MGPELGNPAAVFPSKQQKRSSPFREAPRVGAVQHPEPQTPPAPVTPAFMYTCGCVAGPQRW